MAGTREFEVRNLEFKLTLNVSAETLFKAWTDPMKFQNWFALEDSHSIPIIEFDLRAGAKYRIGIKHPDGTLRIIGGIIKRIIPNELLSFTWSVGGGGTQQMKRTVTAEFVQKSEGSELIVRHQFIPGEKLRLQFEQEWKTRLARLENMLSKLNTSVVN